MKAIFDSNERMPKIGETIKIISLDADDDYLRNIHSRTTYTPYILEHNFVVVKILSNGVYLRRLNNIELGHNPVLVSGFIYELQNYDKKIEDIYIR